jgi:hypothetical protein
MLPTSLPVVPSEIHNPVMVQHFKHLAVAGGNILLGVIPLKWVNNLMDLPSPHILAWCQLITFLFGWCVAIATLAKIAHEWTNRKK